MRGVDVNCRRDLYAIIDRLHRATSDPVLYRKLWKNKANVALKYLFLYLKKKTCTVGM